MYHVVDKHNEFEARTLLYLDVSALETGKVENRVFFSFCSGKESICKLKLNKECPPSQKQSICKSITC